MKADRNGTWTEQVRARMGWKSPKERKDDGKPHIANVTGLAPAQEIDK